MIKELYKFVEGSTVWRYTSSDFGALYDDGDGFEFYVTKTIGRDEPENRNELSKANLTVTLPIDDELAVRLIGTILEEVVTLTVFSQDSESANVIWKGRLASVKPDGSQVKLVFESVATSLRRYGLRMKYQRSCPHVLYGQGCNLNRADFKVESLVLSVSGNDFVVQTILPWLPPYFIGGMVETEEGIMRFVVGQAAPVGTTPIVHITLTLFRPIESMHPGDPILLYPGCDRTKETCNDLFVNLENNGSFPFIPVLNPFGKSIV